MNNNIYPSPTIVRRLSQKECAFTKTVFMSNFRRIIDSNVYNLANIYFNAKKENDIQRLTDAFWFDAHGTCFPSYEKLPLVYPFIENVEKHIENKMEGIFLIDRDKPYYLADFSDKTNKSVCESFNQLLDFFKEVGVLSPIETGKFLMEGYIKFKIPRETTLTE
jgi:hypothetical protein